MKEWGTRMEDTQGRKEEGCRFSRKMERLSCLVRGWSRKLPSHLWCDMEQLTLNVYAPSGPSCGVSKLSCKTSKLPLSSIVLHSVLKSGPKVQTIRKPF